MTMTCPAGKRSRIRVGRLISLMLALPVLWGAGHVAAYGEISCLVEPGRQAHLSTQIPGIVDSILVQPGQQVRRGDVLFRLKRDVELASLELELARAEYAERRFQRSRRLLESNLMSESERDELETELALARRQVNLVRARLRQMETRAPFEGLVTHRHVEEGEYVDAITVLEIVQLDVLRVRAVLPFSQVGRLAKGDTVKVALMGPVNDQTHARVEHVDPMIDPSSGTFVVTLVIENPPAAIVPGINCGLLP